MSKLWCGVVAWMLGTAAYAAEPTAATSPATSLTTSSASLNGSAVPNSEPTTAWFRFSTVDPVTCDDVFGSRVPSAGGQDLGAGVDSVGFSLGANGLGMATTYYYCTIAQNASGTAFGTVRSFTTAGPPAVTTVGTTAVTYQSVTFQGSANPLSTASTGYFRYGPTAPALCDDTFGTRTPTTGGTNLGSGAAAVAYTATVSSILPNTTLYFCAAATNANGTSFGAVQAVTTPGTQPTLGTPTVTGATGTMATLNGIATPRGATTVGWFRYSATSPGTCNDTFGTRAPAIGGTTLGAGNSAVNFSEVISGLAQNTTYYYCQIASNSYGTVSSLSSFVTPGPPTLGVGSVTTITGSSATLNTTVSTHLASSTVWYRYSVTNPGVCDDTFGTRAPISGGTTVTGGTNANVPQIISGLSQGTTYYYCALASNSEGSAVGTVASFKTASSPLLVARQPTVIGSVSATIATNVDANGASTQVSFRWGNTDPGSCLDTWGTLTSSVSAGSSFGLTSASVAISSLSPVTTYYYCAIATNTYGTTYGVVTTFNTTAAAPTVTAQAPTDLHRTTATMTASVNPQGAATTVYFKYATASFTCSTGTATRTPVANDAITGAGTTAVTVGVPVTGLAAKTTYYFCAVGSNSTGTTYSSVLSFLTPDLPTVTTTSVSVVDNVSATLGGTVSVNLWAPIPDTTAFIRYSTTNPGTCNDTFGTRAPGAGSSTISALYGTFSEAVTGLSPATTYYYCALASNAEGTGVGSVLTFVTRGTPSVVTGNATGVTSNSATVSATANPFGTSTNGSFRYGTTLPTVCDASYGSGSSVTSLGSGTGLVSFSASLTGLLPAQTYYYCATATSTYGTAYGTVGSFTTLNSAPILVVNAASNLTGSGARLSATANPAGSSTSAWFRYSSTAPTSCNDTFGTRMPTGGDLLLGSGNVPVAFSQDITGLAPITVYYVCVFAQNGLGTTTSARTSFTTPAVPTATTGAASAITNNSAILNASGNPKAAAATGWFRYATAPGTCNDSYGTRGPLTGGTSLGAGIVDTAFSFSVPGLLPQTTYYYCAMVQNSEGTTAGTVQSFTTSDAPLVSTLPASSVGQTTAVLNAAAIPYGAATNGWFRYATTSPGTCNDTFGLSTVATPLGSGTSYFTFNKTVAGLSPGVTYYVCAIAGNLYGTNFGSVISFTTPSTVPSVVTSAITNLTSTSVTLNGTANPSANATTGWFRYATTSPGTCNDGFGVRAPASGGTSLGSGSEVVAYSENVSGLLPLTNYYFCAIALNGNGTAFGSVGVFTTPAAPTTVTSAVGTVTGNTAVLNGSSNPNLALTTAWFRLDTVNPGTCNDTFGTRAPLSSGTAIGTGNGPVVYSRTATGLNGGTTYYYCAISENSEGKTYGSVLSFTTLGSPAVTTVAASSLTPSSATLNASVNPNGATTNAWFRYSTTDPGACSDTFGTLVSLTAIGSGTSLVPLTSSLTTLTPATTYYFCAIASNVNGQTLGALMSFNTPSSAPVVSLSAPTLVHAETATLNGSVNPGGYSTVVWFRYSSTDPGTCNDAFGVRAPSSGGSDVGSGITTVPVSLPVASLSASTTYYVCAIAQNAAGTTFSTPVQTFATTAPPAVSTASATTITATGATLNGAANPKLSATTGWFRISPSHPGTCNDSFGTRAPVSGGVSLGAGNVDVPYTAIASGLAPITTYYYCAIASNGEGTAVGPVMSFTTSGYPTATTTVATSVGLTSVTFNGSVTPNGLSTSGWFRYTTSDPGTCSDSFGTATSTTSAGSGMSPVALTRTVTGLLSGTTYYFCAIASNSVGFVYGSVMSVTTTTAPPTVGTAPASLVSVSGATLNGFATPNGAASVGYFRFGTTDPGTCSDAFGTRVPVAAGTALGAGSGAIEFSEVVSTAPATTFYFCAVASNADGVVFGPVRSFTTLEPPTVLTRVATPVNPTSATLNGSANPHGVATTAWFRYSTANPGTCNDSFGTRAPAAGSFTVGSGVADATFAQSVIGLTESTTYYFCAFASNSVATVVGSVLSFTTPLADLSVTTVPPLVTRTTASLQGLASPNGAAALAWFRYSETDPGTCNDTFGTRVPATGGVDVGSGTTTVPWNQQVTGLTGGTTYYVCALGSTLGGTTYGEVIPFTTSQQPSVTTVAASSIVGTGATLNGSANPNHSATTAWFRYSTINPGTCDTSFGIRLPASGGVALGSDASPVSFTQNLGGLTPGVTYYYCAMASNGDGTTVGAVTSFMTPAAPTVTTYAATGLFVTGATLQGGGDPNLATATGWFRYSSSFQATCNDSFGTRVPATGGTVLGSGTDEVIFSEGITGLTVGGTYYYCAIASNSVGTSVGTVKSFTLAAVPMVATLATSSVTTSSATINATGNPNNTAAVGWFRYSTTSPNLCNDSFGTRTPSSGGTVLGSGGVDVAFSANLTGLTPGTTYYLCPIVANTAGTSVGTLQSFTTADAPAVTTRAPSLIGSSSVTLRGAADPHQLATTGWLRYDVIAPASCDDTFGTRAPASGGTALGSGSGSVDFTAAITGLDPSTTYYVCAIAQNSQGTRFGEVVSFTTTAAAPVIVGRSATVTSASSVSLTASADPNGGFATGWFRVGTTNPGVCSDSFGVREPATGGQILGAGSDVVPFTEPVTGLLPATTYYFCAIVSNVWGTAYGAVDTFTTPDLQAVTTLAASGVSSTGATFNGSVDPNGSATTGWFRYATTNPGTCNDTFGARAPLVGATDLGSGTTALPYTEVVTGLPTNTRIYYCAVASSSAGLAYGQVLSFTTAGVPTVATVAVALLTPDSVTLQGAANPNLAATTGWFRYDTTSPTACDDTFGTRAPTSGGTSLGSGSTPAGYSQAIANLSAGVTYYYCAIAENSEGKGYGTVQSFRTPSTPSVVTLGLASVSSTGAVLSGSADAHGTATTGWFRYSFSNPGSCDDTFGTRAPVSSGTFLGSAGVASYDQTISGLSPSTTYWYCAIASNTAGTSFGNLESFTTPGAPLVVTSAPTAVTGVDATLNGSGTPNLDATTAWFRYATTRPASCNDTFGTRTPASGGTSLGAGSGAVAFSAPIASLNPGATYYFCAIARNNVGTAFGSVLQLTTMSAPSVASSPPSAVTSTSARLAASANPNGLDTIGWLRFSATNPGVCDDTFGTRAPSVGGTPLGAGLTNVTYEEPLTGLSPGTTYYFCAFASNATGVTHGALETFTTPDAPIAVTISANATGATSAALVGSGDPKGASATGWFRYSTVNPGTCSDTFGVREPLSGGTALGAGSGAVFFDANLSALTAGATYYVCALVSNDVGTRFGNVLTFSLSAVPTVVTDDATDLAADGATLNASVNASGLSTQAWFRISTIAPAACDDTFGTREPTTGGLAVGSGVDAVAVSAPVTALQAATTYYVCAIAQNTAGMAYGDVVSFTTDAAPPTVVTNAATVVGLGEVSLNGSASPHGAPTLGWFRYDTVDPGACDDTFGVRVPVVSGQDLGAGQFDVGFSESVTGLAPGATVYFCAIASSDAGVAFGEVRTVSTGVAAPEVFTDAAADLSSRGARLVGTANPSGAESVGWFRYGTVEPAECSDAFGTRAPVGTDVALGAGVEDVDFDQVVTGLEPNMTYFACAAASNEGGAVFGDVVSFVTDAEAPGVRTTEPVVAANVVTVKGSVDPKGSDSTGWFRYDSVDPGACDDTFGTRVPASNGLALGAGRSETSYEYVVPQVPPGTYYACAFASNEAGLGMGEVITFVVEPTSVTPEPPSTGCTCDTEPTSSGRSPLAVGALVLVALARRRRKVRAEPRAPYDL